MFLNSLSDIFLVYRWENRETFEEKSKISNAFSLAQGLIRENKPCMNSTDIQVSSRLKLAATFLRK